MKNKIVDSSSLVEDKGQQTAFLGKYSGFQRYDFYKYAFTKNIEEKMRNSFWNPEEINMGNDYQKFPELPDHIQEIQIRIWLFQTLMDSGQNRGLDSVMAEITTSPEFEAMFKTQSYFELIHSLSYSHILRGIFSDATDIFDKISDYPEIQHRIDKEVNCYQSVQNIMNNQDKYELIDVKKSILELIVRIFALEGLKFYVSFLVTYVINDYYKKTQSSTEIIKLINFDEDMHVAVMAGTLNILRSNPNEGFSELINSDWFTTMATNIFKEVLEDELEWSKYLLSFGEIPTLTLEVTKQFMEYYADNRIAKIGLPKIYNRKKTDVVNWFEMYKDINKDNVAQQEKESTAYNIGILRNDIVDELLNFGWETK